MNKSNNSFPQDFFKQDSNTDTADVCLLLEGTYPYVRGGVSSWVHQLISGLPDYTFHIVFLGGKPEAYHNQYYELPENVVGFDKYFLLAPNDNELNKTRRLLKDSSKVSAWNKLLTYFDQSDKPINPEILKKISESLDSEDEFSLNDFLQSLPSWEVLLERYQATSANESFVDYFWTFRNIYQPLFLLARISRQLPNATLFHSISTGYAGFLGALAKQLKGSNLILSEHGIYTKERKIDLAQASWIRNNSSDIDHSMHRDIENTRKMWIRFFEQLGLSAYYQATAIISLFGGYQRKQILDGAPPERTKVIVNGINTSRFNKAFSERPEFPPLVIGLIGRVVPIKDIKTFIRTVFLLTEDFPTIKGLIIGPQEEDLKYVEECELLIQSLNLSSNVELVGSKNVEHVLPQLGAVILTSISEAQPLVLLEAMAAGIPCVATDVGACSEMLIGTTEEDRAIGPAGMIVSIANPGEKAKAIKTLLSDSSKWQMYGNNGRKRVTSYYEEKDMFDAYRNLYGEANQSWQE